MSKLEKDARGREEDRPTARSTIYSNVALILGFAPFLILGLKIIYLSDSQISTALTLASTINISAAFFGAFVTVALPLSLICCLLAVSKAFDPGWKWPNRTERQGILTVAFLVGFALVFVLPLGAVLAALIVPLIGVVMGLLRGRRGWRVIRIERDDFFAPVFVALFIVVSSSAAMWLPTERLQLTTGQRPIVYVLEENEKELTVLYADTSKVERINATLIERRTICEHNSAHTQSWRSHSLLSYTRDPREQTPPCTRND